MGGGGDGSPSHQGWESLGSTRIHTRMNIGDVSVCTFPNTQAHVQTHTHTQCGQEKHSCHIISECFSSLCDSVSAPVAITTAFIFTTGQRTGRSCHATNMNLKESLSSAFHFVTHARTQTNRLHYTYRQTDPNPICSHCII